MQAAWNNRAARPALLGVALAAALLSGSGCATYSGRLIAARGATALGDYQSGVAELNRVMGVSSSGEMPKRWKGDHALAALERASLLQASEAFADSAKNLMAADRELEWLEIAGDAVGELGRYVYSDSSAAYKIPASERLALSAVNMLNFLADDDLSGAAVEARRFTVAREYLEGLGLSTPTEGFGSYLAGVVFEKLGDGNRALRYYEEALGEGSLTTLTSAVSRLAAKNQYRGPGIRALIAGAPPTNSEVPSEIIVVTSLGRVPYKIPERIPIGAAVGIAGTYISGNPDVLAYSAMKVVVYPELTPSESAARSHSVSVDGNPVPVELLANLGGAITREYEVLKPQIIGAAISRMIVRAAAAEGMRVAGNQAGGSGGDIVGLFAALVTEGALVALDKPDTRSWSFLADRVFVSRIAVAAGEHDVEVEIQGTGVIAKRRFAVSVPKGKLVVLVVTEPR